MASSIIYNIIMRYIRWTRFIFCIMYCDEK